MENEEIDNVLHNIAVLVECATGVSLEEIRMEGHRTEKKSFARGLILVCARVKEIHPSKVAEFIHRSRPSVIITTQRYLDSMSIGDKEMLIYTEAILNLLNLHERNQQAHE